VKIRVPNDFQKSSGSEQRWLRDRLVVAYLDARRELESLGFANEIEWQERRDAQSISESDFLREFAWVVLCSGMSERNIRVVFPHISSAFFDWQSAVAITQNKNACRTRALRVFGHRGKITAIIASARWIVANGVEFLRSGLNTSGPDFLLELPYMGPATSKHLAKNLGVKTGKPDRHLVRIARATGFDSPEALCEELADATAHDSSVVDIVLWRFATLHKDYIIRLTASP
jgi:hypothetical protein